MLWIYCCARPDINFRWSNEAVLFIPINKMIDRDCDWIPLNIGTNRVATVMWPDTLLIIEKAHFQRQLTSIMIYHWFIHFPMMKCCTFKRAYAYVYSYTHTPIFNSGTRNTLIRCGTLKIVHFRILIQFRFTFKASIPVSELLCSSLSFSILYSVLHVFVHECHFLSLYVT